MKSTSKKWSLNLTDFVKGAIVGTVTPVLVLVQQSLEAGQFVFNWQQLGMAAIGGCVAYLLKNLVTDYK